MDQNLQTILDFIEKATHLTVEEKTVLTKAAKDADKALTISEFKLERTEKVKRTTAILLEETIEELEQKRKAVEAQNRELAIEAALEKIRSRSMAMQHSDELGEVSFLLDTQVRALGIKTRGCAFNIYGEKESTEWFSSEKGTMPPYKTPRENVFLTYYEARKTGVPMYIDEYAGEAWASRYDYLCTLPVMGEAIKKLKESGGPFPTQQIDHVIYFKYGYLLFITLEQVPEAHDIFKRFAKVFEQTYTRFLDLKKAEAQAREAQIEAALERVRAKAMAMHSSMDISGATVVVFNELMKLGIDVERCGIIIFKDTPIMEVWSTPLSTENNEVVEVVTGNLDTDIHPLLQGVYKSWSNGEDYYSYELKGKKVKEYYDLLEKAPDYHFPKIAKYPELQIINTFHFKEGGVFVYLTETLSEDTKQILKRFTNVFSLTYRRYLDIIRAEAQAREAIKQTSLDRVRGEIASMRSTEDLQRITPLVFNELTTLDVPFIRCGVFIINENNENVEVYLSAPDGHSLGVLNLAFGSNELTTNSIAHWRKKKVYHQHWNKTEFLAWTRSMMEQGQVQNQKAYQGAEAPPESLDLHFIPFPQGMLYVGNVAALSEDEIDLVKSLAKAFSIAYARYEDFTKLEHAKQSVENTLAELKATQSQLIQSEKMASLGELTAGIAHEIQNPLNFVNNFSEVSNELVDEMNEEIEKGDLEEVKAIAKDIKLNLEKINHHGKRADGIVKGMLQHSRSSSGTKEPADINKLADEYLRLAYHGLRAKDKSFNAAMETDFDGSLPMVNVVPQDIGRVILNLITNAFYACTERSRSAVSEASAKESANSGYKPTIWLSTKRISALPGRGAGGEVHISVKDNGPGIPKEILDKIFQPFFTTKPTGSGTGLGLSLAYDIIKAHGGELKVETMVGDARPDDPVGRGTEFIIQIPTV